MADTDTRARDSEQQQSRPRLVLRFALYTGAVLLCAGLAIAWLVDREVANRAERTLQAQARTIAEQNLRGHLRASDFAAPVSPERRATLDGLFRNSVVIPGGVGGRLVNPRGTVTYAARHELIGTQVTYPREIEGALLGGASRHVAHMNTWRGQKNLKVLRILVPVRPMPSSRPIGVLELDQDYRSVDVGVGDARLSLALILALALLLLYVSLFPILRRVTRQLNAHNERLHELAEERRKLFEAERAARTEAESVQRLLSEQNDRLRELDRLKDEFVSLVSHELRTPLTSIRGYVELLLDDGETLSADQRRFLEIVDRNSSRLLELVGDLLFLAQIEAGKLAIEIGTVDLNRVVEECVETSSPAADARAIELTARLAPAAPDPGRPGPPRAGARQPRLERDQVHASRRPGRGAPLGGERLGRARGRGQRARDPGGGAGAAVRALLPQLDRDRAGDPGDRPRAHDHEGDRRAARRPDRGRERRGPGHDGPGPAPARVASGPEREGARARRVT